MPPTHAPMSPVTREHDAYWHARPADHALDGLYRDGPHEARPSASLIPDSAEPVLGAPSPAARRATMRLARQRALARVFSGSTTPTAAAA